jgi:hypothetical protein
MRVQSFGVKTMEQRTKLPRKETICKKERGRKWSGKEKEICDQKTNPSTQRYAKQVARGQQFD